ncbi:MAG TPA: hypothetical protein VEH06_16565 [Candidatus Bathyarchaeia archaeon]|nr:hypothetical protein [Candidatus Bathyarchaeia archaeon]
MVRKAPIKPLGFNGGISCNVAVVLIFEVINITREIACGRGTVLITGGILSTIDFRLVNTCTWKYKTQHKEQGLHNLDLKN